MLAELPGAAEWRPVLARELGGHGEQEGLERSRAEIADRAQELGLQPLRWPAQFPFDSTLAMLAATYARQIGRTVPFAQAAFRQAFAGGRSLAEQDTVLIAAAACEMHPSAVLRALSTRPVAQQLRQTSAQAAAAGVRAVPAVVVEAGASAEVFHGERALAAAAAAMARAGAGRAEGAAGGSR